MTAEEQGTGALRRAAKVGKSIVSMHVEVAAREAARDRKRVVGGAVLVLVGAILFGLLLVMLHVAGAFYLRERFGRPWTECALAVAGADLVLGLVFLLAGRGRMRGPIMPETRSMIARTMDALTED